MTDPVNGCRYCGKDRRTHAQEQHAGRGFETWVEPTDEQRKERLRVRAATPPVAATGGSLLDADNLALITEAAVAADYQVWIERVSDPSETAVVIEDGEVA